MIGQFTIPPHLVNRDLKRELRLVPPGHHELIRGIRVYRFDDGDMQRWAINGNKLTLDEAAEICAGQKPVPAYPRPTYTRKPKAKKPSAPKKRLPPVQGCQPPPKPLNTLPLFQGLNHAA